MKLFTPTRWWDRRPAQDVALWIMVAVVAVVMSIPW